MSKGVRVLDGLSEPLPVLNVALEVADPGVEDVVE